MRLIQLICFFLAGVGLASCGGGSGSSEPPAASTASVALIAGSINFEGQTLVRGSVAATSQTPSFVVSDIAGLAGGPALVVGESYPGAQPNDAKLFYVDQNGTVTATRGNWDLKLSPCGIFGCVQHDYLALTSSPSGKVLLFHGSDATLSQFALHGVERQIMVPQMATSSPLAADKGGNVYFFAVDSTLRKLAPDGALTLLASGSLRSGVARLAADDEGNVYLNERFSGVVRKVSPTGVVSTLADFAASDVAADEAGNLYGLNGRAVLKRAVDGAVTPVLGPAPAGTELRPAMPGLVAAPSRLALSPNGLWLIGTSTNSFPDRGFVALLDAARRAASAGTDPLVDGPSATGSIATIVGQAQYGNDPGRGVMTLTRQPARFIYSVNDIAVLSDGSAIAAATLASDSTSRLVKVAPDGVVAPLSGEWRRRECLPFESAPAFMGCDNPDLLALTGTPDGKAVLAYDRYNADRVIEVWGPNGVETRFSSPWQINKGVLAADAAGSIYFMANQRPVLSKRNPDGSVSNIVGSGSGSADGAGTAASFSYVSGLAVDAQGTVYVADNFSIRKVTSAGVVTTLAGQPGAPGAADGMGSAARFSNLGRLAVDAAGNIYAADPINGAVRKITPEGRVTTVAGRLSGASAGPSPTGQVLAHPMSVAVTPQGLWIGELKRLALVPLPAP